MAEIKLTVSPWDSKGDPEWNERYPTASGRNDRCGANPTGSRSDLSCTLPPGHEGVHVVHLYYGNPGPNGVNPVYGYWVKGD